MPLRTETYDLDDEEQRLQGKIEELGDVLEEIDDDHPQAEWFANQRTQLETALEGVRWARDEAFEADYAPMWGEDADSVTLAGLTGGEFGALEDDVNQNGGGNGAIRVYQVAKGTVDAPYIDDSMDDDERVGTVSQLPISYLKWAEARIDELTGVGGNEETSYRDALEAM